ncbi:efflux RND transporter periplasmic adaptor subunit [Actinacidiphila oryziradicis]|nr:peptidoglycan DD-metalloendopeptidase family protein [Actinacidiphila oryziradicis]
MNSVLGVVLLAAVGGAYAGVSSGTGTRAPTGTRAVAVAKGTVLAMVSGSGALVSPSDLGVNFTTGGQLTEVDVKPGDKVTKGEVLAKVDATAANETLTQDQASLTAAQANLSKVEAGQASSTSTGSSGSSGGGSGSGGSGSGSTGASAGTGGSAAQPSGSVPTRSGATHGPTPSASASPSGATHGPTSSASASPSGASSPGARNVSFVQAVATNTTASPSASVDPVQLAQAQAQLIRAQDAVSAAQRAVAGTVLISPVGGTAATVAGKVGETVSSTGSVSGSGSGSTSGSGGSTGSSATPTGFVVITNPTGMQVTADFSEADALKLQPGQAATVTLNAEPGTALNATVLSISSLPATSGSGSGGGSSNSGSAVQYAAMLNITSPTTNLRTGLSAGIQVVTGEASSALYVPTAAVSGTGTNRTVTVVKADGTTQRTSVTVGVEGDTDDQITSGLAQGEQVQITTVSSTGTGGFPGGAFPGGLGGTRGGGGGGVRPGGGG